MSARATGKGAEVEVRWKTHLDGGEGANLLDRILVFARAGSATVLVPEGPLILELELLSGEPFVHGLVFLDHRLWHSFLALLCCCVAVARGLEEPSLSVPKVRGRGRAFVSVSRGSGRVACAVWLLPWSLLWGVAFCCVACGLSVFFF